MKYTITLLLFLLPFFTYSQTSKYLAPTPPMGWNSYNSFGAAVTEAEVRANAEYMAEHMKDLGWEYVVIDYCWFYPHPPGSIQSNPPQFRLKKDNAPVPWIPMDEYGRLLPDPRKFPSSAGGKGFKPLADYIHSLGLKFGIHVMRGIPRQAHWAKTPILGASGITADQIADTTSLCPWLNTMYGVDMSKEGGQAYYNSIIDLYAEWGVDYIKVDDIDLRDNYPYRKSEVEAMRKAIDRNGRPIVLSLSLNMKYKNKEHVAANSQLWRISKDFWDEWEKLEAQFALCHQWSSMSGPDSWPDADMLQIGKLCKRGPKIPERYSLFTEAEQRTHITLWMIARSPLMMGGHMPENTAFVKDLLTNEEVIAANQQGKNPRQLSREDGKVIWLSEGTEPKSLYVAFFNLNEEKTEIRLSYKDLGISASSVEWRNLWEKRDLGKMKKSFSVEVERHDAKMYKISW